MKIPRQVNYKRLTDYNSAYRRYLTKLESDRGIVSKSIDYSYKLKGFQPKSCFIQSEIHEIISHGKQADLHLGIELEVEGIGTNNRDRFSDILQKYLPAQHKVVRDGSLAESGAEIVTIPLTIFDRCKWYHLLKDLTAIGLTSHNNARCGLHVHISKSYLDQDRWYDLQTFIFKYQAFFKKISRRSTYSYCQFYSNGKYSALNLDKLHTREFRFFRGTLNAYSFISSVDICLSLVRYAKTVSGSLDLIGYREHLRAFYPLAFKYISAKVRESDLLPDSRFIEQSRPIWREARSPIRRARRARRSRSEIASSLLNRLQCHYGIIRRDRTDGLRIDQARASDYTRITYRDIDYSGLPISLANRYRSYLGGSAVIAHETGSTVGSEPVRLRYFRAGWGQRSRIWVDHPYITPARDQSNNLNNNRG